MDENSFGFLKVVKYERKMLKADKMRKNWDQMMNGGLILMLIYGRLMEKWKFWDKGSFVNILGV